MNFFYGSICHTCKEKNTINYLKQCSRCKAIAYCCKEHQLQDWEEHRKLCMVIKKTNKSVAYRRGCTLQEWKSYRLTLQAAWLVELGRNLKPYECQMWMFPRSCVICHSRNVTEDCENCLSVSFCCENHKAEALVGHRKFCDGLKLVLDINRYLWRSNSYPKITLANVINKNHSKLPGDMNSLMKIALKEEGFSHNNDKESLIEFILKGDLLSPAASIIYGMEEAGLLQDRRFKKQNLNVHIVGASNYEVSLDWNIITELLLHWIEDVDHIKWTLIGPESLEFDEQEECLCHDCICKGKKATVTSHKSFYHEIRQQIEKPDVLVAFNCGFHEFQNSAINDNWKPTLRTFLDDNNGAPLILTSYTDYEIEADVARLEDECQNAFTIFTRGVKNPYASKRPIRDCMLEEQDSPIFFQNGYIAVLGSSTRI